MFPCHKHPILRLCRSAGFPSVSVQDGTRLPLVNRWIPARLLALRFSF
ncbi:MAG: hypothetical protein OJF47_004097 [Nitrospira sp.]|nr:MAG: hypothetical protein OJF47_004097 [Nitrospira sp.]